MKLSNLLLAVAVSSKPTEVVQDSGQICFKKQIFTFLIETSQTIDANQNRIIPILLGGLGGLVSGVAYGVYEYVTNRTLELEQMLADKDVSNRMSTQATDKLAAELQLLKGKNLVICLNYNISAVELKFGQFEFDPTFVCQAIGCVLPSDPLINHSVDLGYILARSSEENNKFERFDGKFIFLQFSIYM